MHMAKVERPNMSEGLLSVRSSGGDSPSDAVDEDIRQGWVQAWYDIDDNEHEELNASAKKVIFFLSYAHRMRI
jgi:hypothetical protein